MASTKYNQDNVIQSMIPDALRSGEKSLQTTEDTSFATTHHARSIDSGSMVDEHVSTIQAESSSTDQTIICVICLELVDEVATALPCRHDHFHFSCIGTWLQQNRSCPLCKVGIVSIRYHDRGSNSASVFHLPELSVTPSGPGYQRRRSYSHLHRSSSRPLRRDSISETERSTLRSRSRVYERGLYSLYVGNNRISRYRNITPALIAQDAALQSRAKKWVRRELRVLIPFHQYSFSSGSSTRASHDNVFRNNEFLLEYIVAILKNIDIKGSAGQAEVLLGEHLGRKNARLFLHELENWMRSPFETLEEWDDFVQYPGT